jgi:MFS family permease
VTGSVPTQTGTIRNLAAAAGATTACVFPAFLAGGMGVQLRDDLGFGEAGLGLAIGAFFAAASVSSALLGRLAERLGPSAGLRLAAWGSAITQAAIAALARGYGTLLALLAVAGAWNALAQPAANLFVARALPAERQGLAFGVKQSAIPLSTMLAGVAVPTLALTVGWEWAFGAGAALAVLGAVVVPSIASTPAATARGPRDRPDAAPRDAMAVLALGIGLGAAAAGSLGGFLVSAGVASGLDEGVAGLTLTFGSAVGIVVRLASGAQADRREGGHLRVVALMLAGGTVAYCLLATGDSGVHLVATPLAFATGWAWPGLFNLAVVRANPGAPARATGITQTGTYVGAVSGPLLFGFIADQRSYAAAWSVAALMSLCAAAAMLAGRSRLRRARVSTLDVPDLPT